MNILQHCAAAVEVYWKGGRQEWTPPPLVVLLVPQTINHCSTEELSVCGDGRNKVAAGRRKPVSSIRVS